MPLVNQEIANRLLFPDTRKKELAEAQKALLSSKLDPHQLMEAWAIVGESYKLEMEPQISEQAYLKSLEIIQTLKDERLLGEGYKAIGDALHFCKDYSRAIGYYHQSAQVFENLNDTEQTVSVLSQMAYCYAATEQRDDERYCLNRAATHPTILPIVRATLLERIALSLSTSGLHREAIEFYEQALSIFEAEHFTRDWEQRVQSLAQMYRTAGDEDMAKRTEERLQSI